MTHDNQQPRRGVRSNRTLLTPLRGFSSHRRWPTACAVGYRLTPLRGSAFTLIELLAAILLLGIISTAAALTFRSSLQSASATNAIDQIKYLDSTSRQRATRFNQPVEIIFDLTNSTLSRREGSKRNDESFTASLPRGYSIDQVNIAGNSIFNGQASIPCSPAGLTPSYALHLIGPNFDQWLLFAGLSGQLTVINDEQTVLDILAATRQPARRNPD
jgi:prepilin-type N-terminal cleavage/methylation domain-containing protein